eukprot:4290-Heterococcus_DN1.PRE.1
MAWFAASTISAPLAGCEQAARIFQKATSEVLAARFACSQAPAVVTVHPRISEEELQFISFLENSNDDLSKYSRAEVAELVASSGLGLSAGAAIILLRGARKKQLQQQRTSARDWRKAEFLAAAPTMGLSSRKLKQAFGQAKEKKQIEHKPDGT